MSKDTKKEKNSKKEQKNNFMKDLKVELKKVTWPTKKELVSSTATVLFITILLAIIVFVLDFAFEKANTYGVDKLKSVVSSSEEVTDEIAPEITDGITVDGETSPEVTEETPAEGATETPAESSEGQVEATEETEETTAQ